MVSMVPTPRVRVPDLSLLGMVGKVVMTVVVDEDDPGLYVP
jgi:hypothetical protein